MIEVKLLSNKHYTIKNEEALIVEGEHNATTVKVEFPEETAALSKRVDFKSYEGKKTSVGLYTPEIKTYDADFDKRFFEFTIPNEMTHTGELRMQFVAYQPDKDCSERIVIYYQTIILWISEGIARLRKCGEFDDLLTEMAKFCMTADESAKEAWDAAIDAANISKTANEKSDEALDTANRALANSEQADRQSLEAIDISKRAEETSLASDEKSAEALATSQKSDEQSIEAIDTANKADAQSLEAIAISQRAEEHSLSAEEKSDNAVADAEQALSISQEARDIANAAETQSADAVVTANSAETTAQAADSKADSSLIESSLAIDKSNEALEVAGSADVRSIDALTKSEDAVTVSQQANEKSDTTFAQSAEALSKSAQALAAATLAEDRSTQALMIAENSNQIAEKADVKADSANATANEAKDASLTAKTTALQAKITADDANNTSNYALIVANSSVARSKAADEKSDIAIADSTMALSRATQAMTFSNQALEEMLAAKADTAQTKVTANEAKVLAVEAKDIAEGFRLSVNNAVSKASDAEVLASDAKIQAGAARIAADLSAAAAEEAKQAALDAEAYARGLDAQIQAANNTADSAKFIADSAVTKAEDAIAIAETAVDLANTKQDSLGYVPVDVAAKDQPDGFAGLDNNGKVPLELMNDAVLGNVQYQDLWDAASNVPDLDIVSPKGQYYIVTASGNRYGHEYNVGDWIISNGITWGKVDNTDAVASVAGRTGNVVLTKSDVGLSNVDNTSDANKPVSSATQTALNNKVDKVSGKQLSAEDYSIAEKTKLAGIETNANNYVHPSSHSPSIITQDASNRFVSDSEKTSWSNKAEKTQVTTTVDGLMSSADKAKLNGIEENANKYTHPSAHPASIITQDASNRFVSDSEKTAWNAKAEKTAATQSANGLMSASDKTKLDGIESGANKYTHPANHPPGIITQDASNRFVTDTEKSTWNNKAETTTATQSANGLMSSTDKTKLDGIENGANKYAHPSTHPPSIIAQDSSNRFVTDTEKSAWNNKAEKTTATQSANGLMSSGDKTKLDGIQSGAQVNSITGVKGDTEGSYRTGNVNITAANVGAVPTSRTVNGRALSANISITSSDVGLGNVANVLQYSASNLPPFTKSLLSTSTRYPSSGMLQPGNYLVCIRNPSNTPQPIYLYLDGSVKLSVGYANCWIVSVNSTSVYQKSVTTTETDGKTTWNVTYYYYMPDLAYVNGGGSVSGYGSTTTSYTPSALYFSCSSTFYVYKL